MFGFLDLYLCMCVLLCEFLDVELIYRFVVMAGGNDQAAVCRQ